MSEITDEVALPRELSGHTAPNFGNIEADIDAMEEFARRLADELRTGYAPQLTRITEIMDVELPLPGFQELSDFLTTHYTVQDSAHNNIYVFANSSQTFATAAESIGKKYRGTDVFAKARVQDVDSALTSAWEL